VKLSFGIFILAIAHNSLIKKRFDVFYQALNGVN